MEGPYGSLSVDLTSNRYSMVMLLSGGIGVTPMQSIAHQLMYEHQCGERELKKLWFVWTARDPQVMSNMDVVSSHHLFIDDDDVGEDDMEEVGKHEVEDDTEIIDLEMGESVFSLAETMEGLAAESQLHGGEEGESEYGDGELLELDCYLTAKEMQDCGLCNLPFVHQCRPDMKKIFLSMREEAIRRGEKRVAICVCAPQRLVYITRAACVKYSSNRHVRFDFHSEVFD